MSEFTKKYKLPLQPLDIGEVTESLLYYLLNELDAWKLKLAHEPLSAVLGTLVALAINEANDNDGLLDLNKIMVQSSKHLNDLSDK